MDKFYTPNHIATSLINYATTRNPKSIADFSAGNGDLLAAAASFWPNARIIANDFDMHAVNFLKKQFPCWTISKCDFLNKNSRNASSYLRQLEKDISLILLNPPFSCRGGTRIIARIDNMEIPCSTSMAFLLNSIPYLVENGEILAILPRGTLDSQKDRMAWSYIKTCFSVSVIKSYSHRTFSGCFPNTILVKLKSDKRGHKDFAADQAVEDLRASELKIYKIIRGTQQVHKLSPTTIIAPTDSSLPFLHTTKMSGEVVPLYWVKNQDGGRKIKPPAVLIPRVGEPRRDKICIYAHVPPALISDCIIGVECPDHDATIFLCKFIASHWNEFSDLYSGTCAKFVTIENLRKFLLEVEAAICAVEVTEQNLALGNYCD